MLLCHCQGAFCCAQNKNALRWVQKQNLPFPLLSDEGGKLRSALGVKKHYFLIPGRQTFVIDKDSRVLLAFSDLSHKDHVGQALNALKNST